MITNRECESRVLSDKHGVRVIINVNRSLALDCRTQTEVSNYVRCNLTSGDLVGMALPQGHTGAVTGVAVSEDGSRLASASADGTVRVWKAASGECVHVLEVRHRPSIGFTSPILQTQR